MYSNIYKKTIKTILISPVTLLALLATVIVIINGVDSLKQLTYREEHKYIFNIAYYPLVYVLPLFLTIIVSTDILRDKKNKSMDLHRCSQMKVGGYYLVKLAAYFSIAYTIITVSNIVLLVSFFIETHNISIPYTTWEVIRNVIVESYSMSISTVFEYIAFAVFFTLLFQTPVVAIIFNVAYMLGGKYFTMITIKYPVEYTFFGKYIFPVPYMLWQYMYYYKAKTRDGITGLLAVADYDWWNAILIPLGISAILLVIGYILIRRVKD